MHLNERFGLDVVVFSVMRLDARTHTLTRGGEVGRVVYACAMCAVRRATCGTGMSCAMGGMLC